MKQKNYIIITLGLLAAIGPFSIDMYLPAFPAIAADLNTSVSSVSLSLSSFFIGISAGQFIYGPLLDKIGRKKPLYGGLVIYFTASLGCMFASSANALIALRLVQALGGCVGMVASRTMVRDLFSVSDSAKIFSQLMLVIGISPIVAPFFGSYITTAIGWQYIFLTLALLSAILLILAYRLLPESKPAEIVTSAVPNQGINIYLSILKEPQFYKYAISGSCSAKQVAAKAIYKRMDSTSGLGGSYANRLCAFSIKLMRGFASVRGFAAHLFITELPGVYCSKLVSPVHGAIQ